MATAQAADQTDWGIPGRALPAQSAYPKRRSFLPI
jgi:hypothetical protein